VILGSLGRAVDTGMSRETYTSNGKTDLTGGLFKVGASVLDGQAMLADAAIFTAAHGGFKLAGTMTNGALERSNFARTTLIGGSFGAPTGGWQEIQRERQSGLSLDASQIVASSALG